MTVAERQRRVRAGLTRAQKENDMATSSTPLRRPVPLPATREDLVAQYRLKHKRTINDLVQDIVLKLWPDQNFMKYLDATYDSEAVTGSRMIDDVLAAQIIQQTADKAGDSEVSEKKLDTIVRAMKVAQKRFGIGRQQRSDEGEPITPTPTPDEVA